MGYALKLSYKTVDKIYGVLDLAIAVGEYDVLDYHEIVEQVYTAFAVTTLSKWSAKLNELVEAGMQNQGPELQSRVPSRAPDCTCPTRIYSLNRFMMSLDDRLQLPESEREKTSRSSRVDVKL